MLQSNQPYQRVDDSRTSVWPAMGVGALVGAPVGVGALMGSNYLIQNDIKNSAGKWMKGHLKNNGFKPTKVAGKGGLIAAGAGALFGAAISGLGSLASQGPEEAGIATASVLAATMPLMTHRLHV